MSNNIINKNFSALVDSIKNYAYLSEENKQIIIFEIIHIENKFISLDEISINKDKDIDIYFKEVIS